MPQRRLSARREGSHACLYKAFGHRALGQLNRTNLIFFLNFSDDHDVVRNAGLRSADTGFNRLIVTAQLCVYVNIGTEVIFNVIIY